MHQYIITAYTIMKILAMHFVTITPLETTHRYADGSKVYVMDGKYIDSLGLTGWSDRLAEYPIELNDSTETHLVTIPDSVIVRR